MPSRLSSCGVCPAWRSSAPMEQGRSKTATPTRVLPRAQVPEASDTPTSGRCSLRSAPGWSARGRGRSLWPLSSCPSASPGSRLHRSPMGRLGTNVLPATQAAHDSPPARPGGPVEDPMVALELFGLPKTHDAQCATNGSLARCEDRSCK